jgi:hypothetical protein
MTLLPAARIGPDLDIPAQPTVGPWTRSLHAAIYRHDLEAVLWALGRGADPQALAVIEMTPADEPGMIEVRGGGSALHLAVSVTETGDDGLLEQRVNLPIVAALLARGADVQQLTLPFPSTLSALDLVVSINPSNVVDVVRLLVDAGALPTAQTIDIAAMGDFPETPALLDALFDATPPDRQAPLHNGLSLVKLSGEPMTAENYQRIVALVRHGGDIDRLIRIKGSRKKPVSPAQALVRANPERGPELVEGLRELIEMERAGA